MTSPGLTGEKQSFKQMQWETSELKCLQNKKEQETITSDLKNLISGVDEIDMYMGCLYATHYKDVKSQKPDQSKYVLS